MPEEDDWAAWMTYHADLFGLNARAEDLATVATWRDLFRDAGYYAAELRAASDALALAEERPRSREQHLHRLVALLRTARLEQARAQRTAEGEISWPLCNLCGGSGLAIAPLLKHVAGGEWLPGGQTCAVSCTCRAGQREQRDKLMTLRRYEERNPDWVAQVARRAGADRAHVRALEFAGAVDRKLGPLVRALIKTAKGGEG